MGSQKPAVPDAVEKHTRENLRARSSNEPVLPVAEPTASIPEGTASGSEGERARDKAEAKFGVPAPWVDGRAEVVSIAAECDIFCLEALDVKVLPVKHEGCHFLPQTEFVYGADGFRFQNGYLGSRI